MSLFFLSEFFNFVIQIFAKINNILGPNAEPRSEIFVGIKTLKKNKPSL